MSGAFWDVWNAVSYCIQFQHISSASAAKWHDARALHGAQSHGLRWPTAEWPEQPEMKSYFCQFCLLIHSKKPIRKLFEMNFFHILAVFCQFQWESVDFHELNELKWPYMCVYHRSSTFFASAGRPPKPFFSRRLFELCEQSCHLGVLFQAAVGILWEAVRPSRATQNDEWQCTMGNEW